MKKRGLIDSQFHRLYRRHSRRGLKKLTIMAEGKGEASTFFTRWQEREEQRRNVQTLTKAIRSHKNSLS